MSMSLKDEFCNKHHKYFADDEAKKIQFRDNMILDSRFSYLNIRLTDENYIRRVFYD